MRKLVRQANGQTAVQYVIEPTESLKSLRHVPCALFPPAFCELGWKIMRHVRAVHNYPAASKVVACERGEEPLYPSATDFYYDWTNPLEDKLRGDDTDVPAIRGKVPVIQRMRQIWPEGEVIDTTESHGVTLLPVKYKLGPIEQVLPRVDIAICPRFREHVPSRNWPHWADVVDTLIAMGLVVGTIGAKESSQHTNSQVKSWKHPLGPMAGALDLLSHCSVYLGSDTGPSHLASLMDVNMIIFARALVHPLMVSEIKSGTLKPITDLGAPGWDDPNVVLAAVKTYFEIK